MKPSIGRIVHYRLHPSDVKRIELQRREHSPFHGNHPSVGEEVPMTIVCIWPNEFGEGIPGVNGQATLDGNDNLWVTSVKEGTAPGEWHWPEREA